MSSADLRGLVLAVPKAELHVHLEGSIPPATALRLAKRRDVRLPGAHDGEAGLRAAYVFTEFMDFIRLYVAISRCLVETEDFAEAVDDVAAGLSDQNVTYAEMTFTPMTHVARGVAVETMLSGLDEGRTRAAERGVRIEWVFDIVRSVPDQAEPTLRIAEAARSRGVVALGLGGPEVAGTPAILDPVFQRARAVGLHSVPHAGETLGAPSVRAAVERLGAERIGHGVRCLEDPAVVELVLERGVKLEVCPTSNVVLGVCPSLAEHPLPRLLELGIPVSLGSDDPPMFGTCLVDEYVGMAGVLGWDAEQTFSMLRAGVEHSFMSAGEKEEFNRRQQRARVEWEAK